RAGRSSSSSRPMIFAGSSRPSMSFTETSLPALTTWLLVTMRPRPSTTKPEPRATSASGGSSPPPSHRWSGPPRSRALVRIVTTDGSSDLASATKFVGRPVTSGAGADDAGSAAGAGGGLFDRPSQAATSKTAAAARLLLVDRVHVLDAQVVQKRPEEIVFGLIEISLGLLEKQRKEIDGLFGQRQIALAVAVGRRHLAEMDERRRAHRQDERREVDVGQRPTRLVFWVWRLGIHRYATRPSLPCPSSPAGSSGIFRNLSG